MDKRINLFLGFLALLVIMLVPSVALAGPESALVKGAETLWTKYFEPSLVPFKDWGWWGYALSLFISGLAIFGLWKTGDVWRQRIGRVSGFLVLPIAFFLAWMIVGIVWGTITGAIQGGISSLWGSIPGLNQFPRVTAWLSKWTYAIVFFFLVIGVIKYLISSMGSIAERIGQIAKTALIDPLQGKVSGGHEFLGCVLIVMILNRRELNEKLFYVPMGLGAAFGIYQAYQTVWGQKAGALARAKFQHKPYPDGSYHCDNPTQRPLYEEKAFIERGEHKPKPDKNGQPKWVKETCDHHNPAGTQRCQHIQCDQWAFNLPWDCPKCGKKKIAWDVLKCADCATQKPMRPWCCVECRHWPKNPDGTEGIPWATPKCPKCGALRPKRPTTPKHYPWDDVYHPTAPVAPISTAPAVVPADNVRCARKVAVLGADNKPVQERDANGQPVFVIKNGKKMAKGQMGECGTVYLKTAAACPGCGKANPLLTPPPPPPTFELPGLEAECPHCGAKYLKHLGIRYCMECVRDLSAPPEPVVAKAVEEEPEEEIVFPTDEEVLDRSN